MKNSAVCIVAGPCSVDENNIKEIIEIGSLEVTNRSGEKQRAIAGTRVVGIKSRTELNPSGEGMGMDFDVYMKNLDILMNGGGVQDMAVAPSVLIAEEIVKKTNLLIATEIMSPMIQMPAYEGRIPKGKLMPWNPSVNQLGWQVMEMAAYAKRNGWHIGIKNGKWIGDHMDSANSAQYEKSTSMEKTWKGLAAYAQGIDGDIIFIHRGVDVPDKGSYRNALVHEIAKRVKKSTGMKLYFDPSHTYGPKLRHQIIDATVDAMKMKLNDEEYVYDGVLIETGTSQTDTDQHVTVSELNKMVQSIAKDRDLVSPEAAPEDKSDVLFA